MKSLVALLSVSFVLALQHVGFGADQTRDAQAELKSLGFYYGEVNGQSGAETSAAIRRYQIRNGLEVTGVLDKQTLDALGIGANSATAPPAPPAARAPARAPSPAPPAVDPSPARPPVHLRRDQSVEDSDRSFLQKEDGTRVPPERSSDPSVISPPARIIEPSADLPVLFAGTPYATAPPQVQENTLRSAQALLASRGYYQDVVDGIPGPATEEAIFSFQRSARLPLTGRLDLETLAQLRLLPGRSVVRVRPFAPDPAPRVSRRSVFRGVWVE
jgi:peptidoglycan hydrolase-like protein with peptidoglycan-binding domain